MRLRLLHVNRMAVKDAGRTYRFTLRTRCHGSSSPIDRPTSSDITVGWAVRPDRHSVSAPLSPSTPSPKLYQCTNLPERQLDSELQGIFGSLRWSRSEMPPAT